MNTILLLNNKSQLLSSQEVAGMIGKKHSALMRDIRRYMTQLGVANIGHSDFFIESTYIDNKGELRPCFDITRKGCLFIADRLIGKKGTEFTAKFVTRLNEFDDDLSLPSLTKLLAVITNLIELLNINIKLHQRISDLESISQNNPYYQSGQIHSPWFAKMNPKYSMLEEFFGITRGCLYKNILMEMENLYDVDTAQITADYCYENGKESCYPLEPYEFNHKYRELIEGIVNNALISNDIVSSDNPLATNKHITIFDNAKLQ